jgi:hypothetical protein
VAVADAAVHRLRIQTKQEEKTGTPEVRTVCHAQNASSLIPSTQTFLQTGNPIS